MFVAVMNKSYLQGHFVIGFRNVAFVMQQTEDISTLENDVDQKKHGSQSTVLTVLGS